MVRINSMTNGTETKQGLLFLSPFPLKKMMSYFCYNRAVLCLHKRAYFGPLGQSPALFLGVI